MDLKVILKRYGRKYSDILGIKLKSRRESEIFKWFIASILLGARISETLALRTYKQFESEGALSFSRMERLTWDELVEILDAGGYVRYDFSTASNLQAIMKLLKERYKGRLGNLHKAAADQADLEGRLTGFKGVGPVTANIFLREMRGVWKKAAPPLGHLAEKAAKELGTKDPKLFWRRNKVRGYDFANFETALMRLGREARRKKCRVKNLIQQ